MEAIFLGIYIYGWDRLPPLWHWLSSVPLWAGGLLSSIFVVSANSWIDSAAAFSIKTASSPALILSAP
jgi:cytochrome d ubiquinol oxidase subunit I